MSKFNLNPMADWGYVNNSRFRFLGIRNQGGGDSPVPPEPVFPTDRILYTVIEGGTQPTSTWITENCSDNVFDESTGEGYLVLNNDIDIIELPSGCTNIFNDSSSDNNIESIIIPSQIKEIGKMAFMQCEKLDTIVLKTVSKIGLGSFASCIKLSTITLSEELEEINNAAFHSCSSLTSFIIPESITQINNEVFSGCTSLVSVVIPSEVSFIGVGAFGNCTSLTSIECKAQNPPELESDAFAYIATTECQVPAASISAYEGSSWYNNPFTTFTAIRE